MHFRQKLVLMAFGSILTLLIAQNSMGSPWDAVTGVQARIFTGHTNWVWSVAFSPDGRTIASGGIDKTILWDAWTGAHKHTLHGGARSVAFSPDGKTIASCSGGTIRLWDARTGEHKHTLEGSSFTSIAFSPDGRTLVSGDSDDSIRLWDVASGELKYTRRTHTGNVWCVAFSPDGRLIGAGSSGHGGHGRAGTIHLWGARLGTHTRTLTGHKGIVNSVAFSPDGRTIASGSFDKTIRLWDAWTGAHKHTLTGHTWSVNSVAFSPDGRTIASGGGAGNSSDNSIRLWDAGSGAHKYTLRGHLGGVHSVAFSPDGRTIASGSHDGTVLLWEATTSTTVSVSPASVPSPAIGEQLTLSLSIADGETVAGYQATVQFNTASLRYVSSANGDFLPAGAFFVPPVVDGNRVTLASSAIAAVSDGDGTLATITFEVVAVKASTVTLSQVSIVDPDGTLSTPRIEHGEVTEPTPLVGDVNNDGVVNIQDLVIVGTNFGKTGPNKADVNGDGVVNIVDLVMVAGAFGQTTAAPALHSQAQAMLINANVERWLAQARGLDLTDATMQRGIIILEQLRAALTPKETALLPNYPNPFNPETWIPYHLAHAADVILTIYSTKGTVVRQFELGHQPAGFYTTRAQALYWNGRNENGEPVASGLYFYHLTAGDTNNTRRMVILK